MAASSLAPSACCSRSVVVSRAIFSSNGSSSAFSGSASTCAVLVGILRVGPTGLFGLEPSMLLLERVGDVLEEDEAEDDVLVLGGVHGTAQGVGHLCQSWAS